MYVCMYVVDMLSIDRAAFLQRCVCMYVRMYVCRIHAIDRQDCVLTEVCMYACMCIEESIHSNERCAKENDEVRKTHTYIHTYIHTYPQIRQGK